MNGFLPLKHFFQNWTPLHFFCLVGFLVLDMTHFNRKNETAGLLGRHPSWLAAP